MKISEVTLEEVKTACGIYDNDNDTFISGVYMPAAKAFIRGYTGLNAEEIDEHEDLTDAYMVLVNEMYTNREYKVSRDSINPCAKTILDMYCVNNVG